VRWLCRRAELLEGIEWSGAVKVANEGLEAAGREPMQGVTPHSLRRTFLSLLFSLPQPPSVSYVMAQVGHNDRKRRSGSTRR
jgi:integrase